MILSAQKRPMRQEYAAGRAHHYGLRAVASALGLSDLAELRRPRWAKRAGARI